MIPTNYPPQILEIVHRYKTLLQGNCIVDWKTLALQHNHLIIDNCSINNLKELVAKKALEKITITTDLNHEDGKHYTAQLYALSETEFYEMLYTIYRQGFSDSNRINTTYEISTIC